MTTMDVKDASGATVEIEKPLAPGRAMAAASRPVVLATEDLAALTALATALGEVAADPTSNTVLDRLKTIAAGLTTLGGYTDGIETLVTTLNGYVDGLEALITSGNATATAIAGYVDSLETLLAAATPAGSNEIGRTNIKHFNIAGDTTTRPANTTPYTSLDSISNHGTAGSVTATSVTISDTNDDPVDIVEILLDSNDTGFGGKSVRVHLFNSDPTASSGVGAGDNATWNQKRAGWVGSFSGIMQGFSDGAKGTLVSDGSPVRIANVESGGKKLWYQLQALNDATPSANSTTFTPRFKGYQGRV